MTDPSSMLRVKVLNVGQGDAIVVLLPGPGRRRALVVDAYDGKRVVGMLEGEAVEEVAVFLSHSDRDHVAGMHYVMQNFQGHFVAFFYNRDRLSKADSYTSLLRALATCTRNSGEDVWSADFNTLLNSVPGFSSIASPPVTLRVLHPEHSEQSSLLGTSTNEASGVLRIAMSVGEDSERSILLSGDVQLTGLSCMMNRLPDDQLAADVLKYPHHGAWPSAYPGISQFRGLPRARMLTFLTKVDPETIILSVGTQNADNHVRQEVFKAIGTLSRTSGRPRRILCTQSTATCLGGTTSLRPRACAGDIEVRMGPSIPGRLTIEPQEQPHEIAIAEATSPGCAFA